MPNNTANCAVCSNGNGSFDIRFRIQKRNQLIVGSLNVDSRTENRSSLSDCVIWLTAVCRSGHWLQSGTFYDRPLTPHKSNCFLLWLPWIVVSLCGLQTEVSGEGRKNGGNGAMKGRKLYRNRDSVDRNVCPSMSGLREMFVAVYIGSLFWSCYYSQPKSDGRESLGCP